MVNNKEKNFISVVAYIHNSETLLTPWLNYISAFLEEHFNTYELIFVNDYSTDNSIGLIKDWAKDSKISHMINVITMSYYHGIELSMGAGVDLAIGDFVYEFDSLELNYEKDLPWEIYKKCLAGYDITSAVPLGKQDVFSKIFYKLYNWSKQGASQYNLMRETFRLLSRRAINRVRALSDILPYRKAQYMNSGLPCCQMEYHLQGKQRETYDKIQKRNRCELAIESLILFTDLVTKFSLFITGVFLVFAIGTGCYTIYAYFSIQKPVEGWAPIMGFLAAVFSGVFLILTVIVKYLSMILRMIFKKQSYLVQNIEKITH